MLLLGFFYHVSSHVELVSLAARTGASAIILDTCMVPEDRSAPDSGTMRYVEEATADEWNAVGPGTTALVGYPSRNAIRLIFRQFGYTQMREVDWPSLLDDPTDLQDYATDARSTFVLSRSG